jgi:hypothetical protein
MRSKTKVDSIHEKFVQWRCEHRLGAYPRALREQAVAALNSDELLELGERLGLSVAQVRRWGVRGETSPSPIGSAHAAFVELQPPVGLGIASGGGAVELEFHTPDGSRLVLKGAVDASLVMAVLGCSQGLSAAQRGTSCSN